MDGIKAAVRLAIRTTHHGLLKLGERAGFLIGKLAGTTDAAILTTSNGRTSLLSGVSEIIFGKRSNFHQRFTT
jgi:hypothetical protein